MEVKRLVRELGLAPHPEGGWFRETWRSEFLMETSLGPRPVGTSMIYLLAEDTVGRLHRLAWDEVWHWHAGSPLEVHLLNADGVATRVLDGDHPQTVVPAGTWFGETVAGRDGWALAGCTMAPGFDPADCELGTRAALLAEFSHAAPLVRRLTPEGSES